MTEYYTTEEMNDILQPQLKMLRGMANFMVRQNQSTQALFLQQNHV